MGGMIACATAGTEISGVPDEVKLLPLGWVRSQKGDFLVDDESAELIRRHFKERRVDAVIDYEHQTLHDVQAPAGGWIKDIYRGADALMAKVEWTRKAAEYLKNREYRYLSPVVLVRNRDHKAVSLHSAALTNTPAIDGMFAVVNALDIDLNTTKGGSSMDLKELAQILGLPETATEEEVKEAAKKAAEAVKELEAQNGKAPGGGSDGGPDGTVPVANSTILSMLGLKADAKTEDVAASIMTLKAGGEDIKKELLALKQQVQGRDAADAVEKALKAGKISAAQKDWARAYALKDPEGFKAFIEKAPQVVPVGRMELKDAPEKTLEEDEATLEILKACGISLEDAKKYYKEGH